MIIHCWDYPTPEDVPEEYRGHTMQFIEDTPRGTKVSCGYCGEELILKKDINSCPNCGKDLIFGRFDW